MDAKQMLRKTKDWRKDVNELENKVEGHLMNNLQIITLKFVFRISIICGGVSWFTYIFSSKVSIEHNNKQARKPRRYVSRNSAQRLADGGEV